MHKKFLLISAVSLAAAASVELLSWAALCVATREASPRTAVLLDQQSVLYNPGIFFNRHARMPDFMRSEIVHPFLGSIPDQPNERDPYGFGNDVDPIQKRSPGKVIVAVTGGSFAWQAFQFGALPLKELLEKDPAFKGKSIVLIRLAVPGYKQPQQLMALNYLLALGAEFDVLINSDGFNELALTVGENIPEKVFPAFPRSWNLRAESLPSPDALKDLGRQAAIMELRGLLASVAARAPWRWSSAALFAWRTADRSLQRLLGEYRVRTLSRVQGPDAFATRGPAKNYRDKAEMYEDLARLWANSSILMQQLCKANGIRYFHFLQPNQYVAGTKKLNAEELRFAFLKESPYRQPAEQGYPYLIQAGRGLRDHAVAFYDLTGIFRRNEETLYVDDCCHLNERGYLLFISEVARTVIAHYKEKAL